MSLTSETIKKSINALIHLQEIDGKIFKLRSEEKGLPPELADLKSKFEDTNKNFKAIDRTFKDLDRERRALELRTLTLQEDLKRAEAKKRDVRNTKEEFAATKEFEAFQRKVQEVAKSLEERQKLTQEKQTLRDEKQKQLDTFAAQIKESELKRAQRVAEVQAEIKGLEDQRHHFIQEVDEEVFSIYERVQKIRSGNGLASVRDLMCSGCYVTIPPQLSLSLDKMDSVITCPSCSRILYTASDVDSSSAA